VVVRLRPVLGLQALPARELEPELELETDLPAALGLAAKQVAVLERRALAPQDSQSPERGPMVALPAVPGLARRPVGEELREREARPPGPVAGLQEPVRLREARLNLVRVQHKSSRRFARAIAFGGA